MNSIKKNKKEKTKLGSIIKNNRYSNNYILKSPITGCYPEFRVNKTIRQYIKTKLYISQNYNDEGNNQHKYNTNKKSLNNKNNKKNLLLKNKNKSDNFSKNINKLLKTPKQNEKINSPNIEESNNHNSTMAYTINACKSDNLNEILKKENDSYENINSYNSNITTNENNENLKYPDKRIKNELIIKSKKNLSKKINVNKSNRLIKKRTNKIIFKKENYGNKAFSNNKSSNNIFEGKEIYSAIKNLEKYKAINKAWNFKENKKLSDDKIKSLPKNCTTINELRNEKINVIYKSTSPKFYNKRISLKKNNRERLFKTEKKINSKKTGNFSKIKEDNIFSNPIIKNLFNNANKIEKNSLKKRKEYSNSRFNNLLGNYKNECLTINNNNTYIIKCGYSFKGRYFFEYRNQLQN